MLAYPGYTVRTIEDELSWREVRLLMAEWAEHPPAAVEERRIRQLMERQTGARFVAPRPMGGDALVRKLESLGWLGN